MKLIAGLGNKGKEYEATRHNIGFEFLDYFAGSLKAKTDKKNKYARWAEKSVKGNKVILLKPLTFMNLSGEAVKFFASKHKVKPEDIAVIHDDIDLELYKVKIKFGGGDAGHKGIISITEKLGTPGFARVRIGVGRPETKGKTCNYVLGKMSAEEAEEFSKKFESIKDFIMNFIIMDYNKAAGRFRGN